MNGEARLGWAHAPTEKARSQNQDKRLGGETTQAQHGAVLSPVAPQEQGSQGSEVGNGGSRPQYDNPQNHPKPSLPPRLKGRRLFELFAQLTWVAESMGCDQKLL